MRTHAELPLIHSHTEATWSPQCGNIVDEDRSHRPERLVTIQKGEIGSGVFASRVTLCTQDKSSRRQRESNGVPLPHSHRPLFQHCHLLSIFSQHWGHNSLGTVSLLGPTWCVGPGTDFPTCFCPQLYQTRVRERIVDKDRVQVCSTRVPQTPSVTAPRHADFSTATLQHQKQTSTPQHRSKPPRHRRRSTSIFSPGLQPAG